MVDTSVVDTTSEDVGVVVLESKVFIASVVIILLCILLFVE